jgi:hypothetical protein
MKVFNEFLSSADNEQLAAIEAVKANGGDPFGDHDGVEPATAATTEAAKQTANTDESNQLSTNASAHDDANANAEGEAKADADGQLAQAAEAAEVAPTTVVVAPTIEPLPAEVDFKGQRAALLAEESAALKQLLNGEIDDEQFAAKRTELAEKLDDVTYERARYEALKTTHEQAARAHQTQVIESIKRTKDGVDYETDESARMLWDKAAALLAADDASKDFLTIANDAHRMVLAMRGIVKPDAGADKPPKPAQPAAKKEMPAVPLTLRNLPSASTHEAGSLSDRMAGLSGTAYEEAFARLSPAERNSLL